MSGGYKTVTVTHLGGLLFALKTGTIHWSAARVWMAGLEMVAIREAAARCRRKLRQKASPVCFKREELLELTGLTARSVTVALAELRSAGLAVFSKTQIVFSKEVLGDVGDFVEDLAGGRSIRRPVPIPRPLLRFLAAQPTAALGKVMLGYICRGLTIARSGGVVTGCGTVKATWLANMLGLSERSVRYAQSELRAIGWIGKDTGSKQWKLNRDGAWFSINLDWTFVDGKDSRDTEESIVSVARPPSQKDTQTAPPIEDRKTPSESKNRKTGFLNSESKSSKPASKQPPSLNRIRLEDLQQEARLRLLHQQAIAAGWVRDCEADALNFFGAAVRARSVANGDPVRIFVSLVRKRMWGHITQAQEEVGKRLLRPTPRKPEPKAEDVPKPCVPIKSVLDQVVSRINARTDLAGMSKALESRVV